MDETEVIVTMTHIEATVLLGLLLRFNQTNELTIEDPAERRMLWNLHCVLEKLDQASWPSIAEARLQLRDPEE